MRPDHLLHGGGRARRRRFVAAPLAFAAMSLMLTPAISAATVGHTQSLLQKGLKWYQGRTVTVIAPDAPGGGYDTWARILAPGARELPRRDRERGEHPCRQHSRRADTAAHAADDGLTIGMMNVISDLQNQVKGTPIVNFNPEKVNYIGMTPPGTTVWFLSPNSSKCPYTSWSDLVHNTSQSAPISQIFIAGSSSFYIQLANIGFGISGRYISGYAISSAGIAGWQRGDACMDTAQPSVVGPLITGGKAVPIAVSQAVAPQNSYASILAKVPTLAELEKSYAPTTKAAKDAETAVANIAKIDGHIVFVPPRVADYKLAALRSAMTTALTSEHVRQQALLAGQNIGYISATKAKDDYAAGLRFVKPIAVRLH